MKKTRPLDSSVGLEQRGGPEQVVLVREARLAYLEAEGLYGIPERGDRLIAATASSLECPLITNDSDVGRVAGVATIW